MGEELIHFPEARKKGAKGVFRGKGFWPARNSKKGNFVWRGPLGVLLPPTLSSIRVAPPHYGGAVVPRRVASHEKGR